MISGSATPFNPSPLLTSLRAQRSMQRMRALGTRGSLGGNLVSITLSNASGSSTASFPVRQQIALAGVGYSQFQVQYTNWVCSQAVTNAYTGIPYGVAAAIEYPLGTLRGVFTFSGAHVGIVPGSGPDLFSDVLNLFIPPGVTTIYLRSFFTIPSGLTTCTIPAGFSPIAALNEGQAYGTTSTADYTTTVANTATGTGASPGAYGIYAVPCVDVPAIGLLGDSLIRGRGDDSSGTVDGFNALGNGGPYQRALEAFTFGQVRNCRSGTLARDWASAAAGGTCDIRMWRNSLQGVSTLFVQLGTNDIAANLSATAIQGFLMDIYLAAAAQGVQVIPCTIPPRTTSTDSWATTGNQTPQQPSSNTGANAGGSSSTLGQLNAWIRSLPNTLSGGLPFVPAIFDGSDIVSTARDSGIWKAPNWTKDGTHWQGTPSGGVGIPAVQAGVSALLNSGIQL